MSVEYSKTVNPLIKKILKCENSNDGDNNSFIKITYSSVFMYYKSFIKISYTLNYNS